MRVQLGILAGMNPELGHHLLFAPADTGIAPAAEQDAEARRAEILRQLLDKALEAAARRTSEVH